MGLNSTTFFECEGSGWSALGSSSLGGTLGQWKCSHGQTGCDSAQGCNPGLCPAPRATGRGGHAPLQPHPDPQEPSAPSPAGPATPCASSGSRHKIFVPTMLSLGILHLFKQFVQSILYVSSRSLGDMRFAQFSSVI